MTRTAHQFVSSAYLTSAILLLAATGRVMAETDLSEFDYEYTSPTEFHQPVPPLPVEQHLTLHHSSTAAEGFMRGLSAVIQAWGNYELATSQARILNEQARTAFLENKLKQTKVLHTRHRMWRDERQARREYRDAQLEAGREKLFERRQTVHRQAYQLSPTELNMVTGEINWPAALQSAKYQASRERMEELFRQHVSYGDPQPSVVAEITRGSKAMARALKKDLGTMAPANYLAAQKFLLGLKLEASASA